MHALALHVMSFYDVYCTVHKFLSQVQIPTLLCTSTVICYVLFVFKVLTVNYNLREICSIVFIK